MPYKSTLRQRFQARTYANESFIKTVKLYKCNEGNVLVKSVVYRSQRRNDDGHRIDLSVGKNSIVDAHCSCKAGVAGESAHVLAVVLKLTDWVLQGLIEVPSQPASTSMPQQWDKPRGERIEPEPVSCMVISKPGNSNRKKRPLTSDFVDNRYTRLKIQLLENDISHLQSLGATPIAYLASWPESLVATDHGLQPVGSTLAHQLPLLQPVGPTDGGFPCTNMKFPTTTVTLNVPNINNSEKLENVSLSKEDAQKLNWNTRDKNGNQLSLDERKKRITASNFGRFMLRKAQVTQKFVSSVVNPKKITSAATSYGSSNEKVAKNMYRKKTKNHLHECGLIVNPAYPYIGATPDGKIYERSGKTGILEVKCPFSIRDMTVKDAVNDEGIRAKLCVKRDGGNIVLKQNHAYWYQVQGQLLVTGAEFCDLLYTPDRIQTYTFSGFCRMLIQCRPFLTKWQIYLNSLCLSELELDVTFRLSVGCKSHCCIGISFC